MSDKLKQLRDNNPIVDMVAGFIPGVGEVQDAHDFYHAFKNKDLAGMMLASAGFIFPLLNGSHIKNGGRFFKRAVEEISDNILEYLPKGTKIVGILPNGTHKVSTPEGKTVIAEIFYKDLLPVKSYGFDSKKISQQALEEFNDELRNPFLHRLLQSDNKYADAAQSVIDGTTKAKFTTGNGRLLEPNARDVLTAEILGDEKIKTVGFLGTKPIKHGRYRSSGKFGNFSSITDTPNLKYGYYDFEEAEQLIKNAGLNKKQEKYGLDLIKQMKKYETPEMSKNFKDTTSGNLKLNEKETEEYFKLIQDFNNFMSDLLIHGTRNHRIIADAPLDKSIVTIKSRDPRFGDQLAKLNLDLIGASGLPLQPISPIELKRTRSKFNNILDAERTVGGWNDNENAQALVLKDDKNLIFPLHVKGIGPNPVTGMTTLQVDNIHPSLKQGGYVTFYKRFKEQN